MKKLKLKNWVKNTLWLVAFYSVIVIGIIILNARFNYLNQQKSTDQLSYRTASTN